MSTDRCTIRPSAAACGWSPTNQRSSYSIYRSCEPATKRQNKNSDRACSDERVWASAQRRCADALRGAPSLWQKAGRSIAPTPRFRFTWSMSLPTVSCFVEAIIWSTSILRLRNAGPSTVYDPSSSRKGATCSQEGRTEGGHKCEHIGSLSTPSGEKNTALSLWRASV